jgi:Mce-associated membrane protein
MKIRGRTAMTIQTDDIAGSTDDQEVEVAEAADVSVNQDLAHADEVAEEPGTKRRPFSWTRALGFGILPACALCLALGTGYLKWQYSDAQQSQAAAVQSVPVASEATVAVLSYTADSAAKDLNAARDRLTGTFRDEYTKLINEVVIPGAAEKKISVQARVAAAAPISATNHDAVVLVFVDQTTTVGDATPTDTASTVKVTLEKEQDRWLVSGFEPV